MAFPLEESANFALELGRKARPHTPLPHRGRGWRAQASRVRVDATAAALPPSPRPSPPFGGRGGKKGKGRCYIYSAARLITGSTRFSSSSGIWQAMRWPLAVCHSGGGVLSQIGPTLRGQRVAKGQPGGTLRTLGTLPSRMIRFCLRSG